MRALSASAGLLFLLLLAGCSSFSDTAGPTPEKPLFTRTEPTAAPTESMIWPKDFFAPAAVPSVVPFSGGGPSASPPRALIPFSGGEPSADSPRAPLLLSGWAAGPENPPGSKNGEANDDKDNGKSKDKTNGKDDDKNGKEDKDDKDKKDKKDKDK